MTDGKNFETYVRLPKGRSTKSPDLGRTLREILGAGGARAARQSLRANQQSGRNMNGRASEHSGIESFVKSGSGRSFGVAQALLAVWVLRSSQARNFACADESAQPRVPVLPKGDNNMAGRLQNKVAIITGGNSGIGEATALRFVKEGAKVALLARREAEGNAVQEAIRAEGGDATFIQCDVTSPRGRRSRRRANRLQLRTAGYSHQQRRRRRPRNVSRRSLTKPGSASCAST